MTPCAYFSHPIGPADDIHIRQDNISNASEWLRFLIGAVEWAMLCPWLAYMNAMGRDLFGPRALRDQIMLLRRCDLVVQVGGYESGHMEIERNHAIREGIQIVDLTTFGPTPPYRPNEVAALERLIQSQMGKLKNQPSRRVWLPRLDAVEIDVLRMAQRRFKHDPDNQDLMDVISRIVQAALRP